MSSDDVKSDATSSLRPGVFAWLLAVGSCLLLAGSIYQFVGFIDGQVQVKRTSDGQVALGGLTLTGRIVGDPKPVALIAFNDPASDPSDYDAVGWPTRVEPDGTFRVPIADLLPGAYELRLRVYCENGQYQRFAYSYQVDSFGRPDVRPLQVGQD